MNKRHIGKALIRLALMSLPSLCLATVWVDKTVAQLQSYVVGGDCLYFTLAGVTEADPVFPGSAWFAISRTQAGLAAKDAYAMLLSAKLTGQTLQVSTNGTLSCGYATASEIIMQ